MAFLDENGVTALWIKIKKNIEAAILQYMDRDLISVEEIDEICSSDN